jgi:hypothetical protein
MRACKFIVLQFGKTPVYRKELRYCLRSLLADRPEAAGHIVIYTDDAAAYADVQGVAEIVDIAEDLPRFTQQGSYIYRAKICVLIDALQRFGTACVFLDTDSFILPGFGVALQAALGQGACMNHFIERDPFPDATGFEIALPSGKTYLYRREEALLYNSGLVAVRPEHLPALDDALAFLDAFLPPTRTMRHDQEQFAIGEMLRLHGIAIGENRTTFIHYCSRWWKNYMHWRFSLIRGLESAPLVPVRPHIALNKTIARLFKLVVMARLLPSNSEYSPRLYPRERRPKRI